MKFDILHILPPKAFLFFFAFPEYRSEGEERTLGSSRCFRFLWIGMTAGVGSATCRTDISVDVKCTVSWRMNLDGCGGGESYRISLQGLL